MDDIVIPNFPATFICDKYNESISRYGKIVLTMPPTQRMLRVDDRSRNIHLGYIHAIIPEHVFVIPYCKVSSNYFFQNHSANMMSEVRFGLLKSKNDNQIQYVRSNLFHAYHYCLGAFSIQRPLIQDFIKIILNRFWNTSFGTQHICSEYIGKRVVVTERHGVGLANVRL